MRSPVARRNPSRRSDGLYLWYGFGLPAIAELRRKGVGVTLPLVVRATELEQQGYVVTVVVVPPDSFLIAAASSDGDVVLLRSTDPHGAADAVMTMIRDARLPPTPWNELRRIVARYKAARRRRGGRGTPAAQMTYDAISQLEGKLVATLVVRGFAGMMRKQ